MAIVRISSVAVTIADLFRFVECISVSVAMAILRRLLMFGFRLSFSWVYTGKHFLICERSPAFKFPPKLLELVSCEVFDLGGEAAGLIKKVKLGKKIGIVSPSVAGQQGQELAYRVAPETTIAHDQYDLDEDVPRELEAEEMELGTDDESDGEQEQQTDAALVVEYDPDAPIDGAGEAGEAGSVIVDAGQDPSSSPSQGFGSSWRALSAAAPELTAVPLTALLCLCVWKVLGV
eukprot:g79391.t1